MNLHPIMARFTQSYSNEKVVILISTELFNWRAMLAEIHDILEASICKALSLTQGSTIGVRCICTYAYFYWRTHDFEHVYVDTYTHFFSMIL